MIKLKTVFHRTDGSLVILVLFSLVAYLYTFLVAAGGEGTSRFDRPILFFLVVIFITFIFKCMNISIVGGEKFRQWLLAFILLYCFYAIISLNPERAISYLPTVVFTLSSFYFFFYQSYLNKFTQLTLNLFVILLIVVALVNFNQILSSKIDVLGENFYKQSNNGGYLFVMLLPLALLISKRKMFLSTAVATIFMIFVLYSMKRGAILTGGISYMFLMYSNFRRFPTAGDRFKTFFISAILVGGMSIYLFQNLEIFIYRFELEGGSGRDQLYPLILGHWSSSNLLTLIFGQGFFSTIDVTKSHFGFGLMAHNDWLEIISDLGIIGIFIYLAAFLNFWKQYTLIKRYNPSESHIYAICLIVWLLKSAISGVFMDKGSILIFICMGVILGTTYRNVKVSLKA